MGFFCVSFESTIIISEVLLNLLPGHFFEDMFMLLLSYIPLLSKPHVHDSDGPSERYYSPSPPIVPVPIQSLKGQLRVMEYSHLLKKSGATKEGEEGDSLCLVCLHCIGGDEEVRELGNCCHSFHKECIDVWMDQGQGTCPLCRSNLLPAADEQGEKLEVEGDPWRRERMIYLFGDDFVMGTN